jgi:hypothetical protein
VGALANEEVGKYLNEHCVNAFQKVGTFRIVNGQKQGGNVASYFCLGDGSVLHAVAGPVDAATLLREARWVVETRKLALFEGRNNMNRYREVIRRAHLERLKEEHGIDLAASWASANPYASYYANPYANYFGRASDPRRMGQTSSWKDSAAKSWSRKGHHGALDKQGQVHQLLAQYPMAKIQDIYRTVFEKVLNEKISTLPVQETGR